MGLRSRDSIARANGVVNERAARKGLRGLKTTFRGKRRRAKDDDDDDDATGTATGRRGVRGGGARIKWPDQASASDVRAPEEEEGEAGTGARGGGAEATTTARGGGAEATTTARGRSSSTSKRLPLETLIEYEVTESEGSLEKFERVPSAGAGRFAGAYEDDDSDDSFDTEEDVRAMREAMRDLKYGDDDDRKCCCVVQ